MIRIAKVVTLVLAALLASGAELRAQTNELTREQVIESGASTAYDAVMRLRPEWTSTNRMGGFAVFVNESRQGDLNALREIPVDLVVTMEFLEGAQLNARLTSLSASYLAAAIFVTTSRAGTDDAGRQTSWFAPSLPTFTVSVGSRVASGDDWTSGPTSAGFEEAGDGPGAALDLQATVGVDLSSTIFLELFYGQDASEVGETYWRAPIQHLRVSHRARRMGAMIGREIGPARLAVGPMGLITLFRTRSGECYCAGGDEYEAFGRGVAAQLSYPLPLVSVMLAELRVMGQYVQASDQALWPNGPEVRIGGAQLTAGFGMGVGPRR